MNKCECERFICAPVQEFVDGEQVDSDRLRVRFDKGESGHITGSNIIETGLVDCEIKHAGQIARKIICRSMGELSIKQITKDFMVERGMPYED